MIGKPPKGALSWYRWMEEQAKLPKPENAPKFPKGDALAPEISTFRRGGTCAVCGDWDCGRHSP
jgi:hypothetical protein